MFSLLRHPVSSLTRTITRAMSSASKLNISPASPRSPAPTFKPFTLALIQLGRVGADKAANLTHARDMIRRAAAGEVMGPGAEAEHGTANERGKPDLIVLPVRVSSCRVKTGGRMAQALRHNSPGVF